MPVWKVGLYVYGPITIQERIRLTEPKGVRPPDEQFYSNIDLRSGSYGVNAELTARADTGGLARKAALFFFGQMLDMLSVDVDLPLYTSLFEGQSNRTQNHPEKRIIEPEEWHSAFSQARLFNHVEPTFLRSIGWYRKGLYTEDPFDKFLAFWNSIEIAATKYSPPVPPKPDGTPAGSKDKIRACFDLLWGPQAQWPLISTDQNWIRDNYNLRVGIAHGVAAVDVKQVDSVLEKLPTIREVAHRFLVGWKHNNIMPPIPDDVKAQFLI